MADTPATDAALTDPRQDRLNFEPLAAGISRFLRNPATEPPLTLAITGDWGSGKSSLMGLICADLRAHGSRPIWFNAWHHQKEDHLFAALLGALSKQAPPPWLSLDGIGFRLRLLWLRSRKHWVFTLLLCTAVTALVTWHLGMNDAVAEAQRLRQLGDLLTSLGGWGNAKPDAASTAASTAATTAATASTPWAGWLALLTVAGTTLAALRKALTAFGADPAALLAGGLQGMKPKLAAEQNSFRTRFAEQFGEVSQALPERIVVVIDDLDRCRPEAVLEIMEAVNFLTSSGQCFVLFGMATDKVQAALAIAFERIAKELASGAGGEKDPEAAARRQRRDYAANYLQKLINLEIKVPTEQSYEAWRLLTDDPATAKSPSWRGEAMDGLRRHAMWLALAAAMAVGVSLGVLLRPEAMQAEAERAATPAPSPAASSSAPATAVAASAPHGAASFPGHSASDPALAWGASPDQSPTRVLVQSGQDSHADEWFAAVVLAVGAALAGLLLWRAASRRHREATDSKDFRDALKVWTELVRESAHTPRAVKRFGNKLRYFEMLQQGEARDRTLLDELRTRLRRFTAKRDDTGTVAETPRGEPNRRIAAPQLVALGALHEAFGPGWLSRFDASLKTSLGNDFPTFSDAEDARLVDAAEAFIRQHTMLFDTGWPPGRDEVEVFSRLLDGIRMPGESEELDMRRPSVSPSVSPSVPPSSVRPDVK
ncbi:KAP family P-loop NTPase fold protein [Roseateles chitinivorans]|uniref:KAP family P-loop NTPase fold protein n=1 Tax=Roseateles chitinivorans TaxID=2917965 RepID=UPI003D67C310